MEIPAVSIIIPALNEERYLPLLLDSLRRVTSTVDIIVVDGSSEDGTADAVKAFQHQFAPPSSLTVLEGAPRNISHQRNLGAQAARHDLLVFCDADVIFPPGTFERMVSDFIRNAYVVAAPKLVPLERGLHFRVLYWHLRVVQRVLHACGRAYFPGGCVVTRKELFMRIGGFDEHIPLGEDIDYSLRASRLGKSGILDAKVPVSMRRHIKYGYLWVVREIPNIIRLISTGRIKHETIYYPFGAYSGHEAHHVTGNTHGAKQ